MITRKKRTAAQRDALAFKQASPVGIGPTREEQRTADDAEEARVIAEVRDYIWRTRPCCQLCGGARKAECEGFPDEMHEDPSRAKTRGRPVGERFNLVVCGRVCHRCHSDLTENRIAVQFTDMALGFMAKVIAVLR